MRLLLDTRLLLWWLAGSRRLPRQSRELIRRTEDIFVSAATAWEIAIKKALGRLNAPNDLEAALAASRFQELPISVRHAVRAGMLPRHHYDLFDRMLVAQAQVEGLTLLTHDERLEAYGRAVLPCTKLTGA